MYVIRKQSGSSLIEVLVYVAILGILGTILTGYFMATVNSEAEHNKRDALATSAQNITAALHLGLTEAKGIDEPPPNAGASPVLQIASVEGVMTFSTSSSGGLRMTTGTTTTELVAPTVRVSDISFYTRSHYEPSLSATTTSVEYHITLMHRVSAKMQKELFGVLLLGKDAL